ncbi:MAG: transcription-repair coupling factor (superfamily II helicase), partial [Lentimonas sp.]
MGKNRNIQWLILDCCKKGFFIQNSPLSQNYFKIDQIMDYKIQLKNISKSTNIKGAPQDSIGFLLSKLIENSSKQHFLHIAKDDKEALEIERQIDFFSGANNEFNIQPFPAWDCLPFDRVSPKQTIIASRVNCLHKLSQNSDKKTLVISTINAVLQKTIPASLVKNLGFQIEVGEEISTQILSEMLVENGFTRTDIARDVSEFAIRGNIVDIICPHNNFWQEEGDLIGYRLDLFGLEVESIKVFDPLTQITSNKINKINLLPMAEVNLNESTINNFRNNYRNLFGVPQEDLMYNAICEGRGYDGMEHFMPLFFNQELGSFFDYLKDPQISFYNQILNEKNERLKIIPEYYQARVDGVKESRISGSIYNPIPPEKLYLNDEEFLSIINSSLAINLSCHPGLGDGSKNENNERILDLKIKPIPDFSAISRANKTSVFELLKEFLTAEFQEQKIILSCFSLSSIQRIKTILSQHEIKTQVIESFKDTKKLSKSEIGVTILPISSGFNCPDLIVIGESSLLGEKISRSQIKSQSRISAENILAQGLGFDAGELIVHRFHGIGKFDGLKNIEAGGIKNDFLKILYFESDVLFVPVEDINLISRYGSESSLVNLDKLGGNNWKIRRDKVRKRIKVAAEELIKVAAARHIKKA